MISYEAAHALLRRYGMKAKRMVHCEGVARLAYDTACAIRTIHPDLQIDPEKVRIAALLHDIGRCVPGHHELNSIDILKKEGLEELAALVMHGTLYEQFQIEGIENPELLPHSLENKIVAWADTRFRLKEVSLEERIADIRSRRGHEQAKIAAVERSIPRMQALSREIEALLSA